MEFTHDALTLRRDIRLVGEKIGAIAIVYDLAGFHAKMRRYAAISAMVLVFSVLAALLISAKLLKAITAPILALAEVAARVTKEEDYTHRVVAGREGEVGKLVQSFNQMLEHIRERDTALQEAKDDLEHRVEARTAELQREVNERIRAEEKLQNFAEGTRGLEICAGPALHRGADGRPGSDYVRERQVLQRVEIFAGRADRTNASHREFAAPPEGILR